MKILHLTGDHVDQGGILSVIRQIQEASQGLGWDHTLWAHSEFKQTRAPELKIIRSPQAIADSASHLSLFKSAIASFLELRHLLNSRDYDVIHAHSRGAFLISAFHSLTSRRPILFTNHTYANRTRMYRWGAGLKSMHTVALSPAMKRHYGYEKLSQKQRPSRVHIISACCADRQFDQPLKSDFQFSSGDPLLRLVGVGILARWKRWDLAIDAIAKLPEAFRKRIQLDIWGPTPPDEDSQAFEKELKNQIMSQGVTDQVQLKGSTNQVNEKLQAADLFIIPSTNEPCSVALMEALALGQPALASRSGGNVDILDEEKTGLLFEPDSSSDLAEQIIRVLKGEWQPFPADQIRESVRKRSASQITQEYRKIYEQLAGW